MLEELHQRASRSGLAEVILIDVWEGTDARVEAQRFCDMWGIEATVLLDETAEYVRSLGIRGVPTNVIVDASGIVRAVGATTPAELHAELLRCAPAVAALMDPQQAAGASGDDAHRRGPLTPPST